MFEKLDQVNWNDLNTEGLSELLRSIVSSTDEDTYIECLDTLSSKIFHQNLVFEVTAHVVPFLIEILAARISPQDKDMLHLLAVIAGSPDLINDGSKYELWARNAHDEVSKGLELYFQYLNSSDAQIIRNTVWLLGHLKEHSYQIVPLLIQALNAIEDSVLNAMVLKTIGSLYQDTPNQSVSFTDIVIKALGDIVNQDKRDLVAVTASSIIVRIQGNLAPQRAIDNIAVTLEAPSSYLRENWQGTSLITDLCKTLYSIDAQKRFEILKSAMEKSDDIMDIFTFCFALLDSVFDTRFLFRFTTTLTPYTNMYQESVVQFVPITRNTESAVDRLTPELNSDGIKILRVILENDQVWAVKTNFFELVGLPSTRSELHKMILQH